MRNNFLAKPPEERHKVMTSLVGEFRTRAFKLNAPFTILVYGSASYGLKPSKFGHLDDIDLILVIPRELSVEEILRMAEEVFQTQFDVEPDHVHSLQKREWDMCRMYGESKGVRLGFRLLCVDTFVFLNSPDGQSADVRNVAKVGQSRIVVDVEWSVKQWKYVPMELESVVIERGDSTLLVVNHYVFSKGIEHLGALGRKLLTCTVVYDPTKKSKQILQAIWRTYVQSCLKHQPTVSTGEIIDSVMRAEKFSLTFRRRLLALVNRLRN